MPRRAPHATLRLATAVGCSAILGVAAAAGQLATPTPAALAAPPTPAPAAGNQLSASGSYSAGVVMVKGRLTDRRGQAITAATVTVTIDDDYTGTADTDTNGTWQVRVPVPDTFSVGPHDVDAIYLPADADQSASATTTIERTSATPTKLTVTVARSVPGSVAGPSATVPLGQDVTVQGRFVTASGAPLRARQVSLDAGPDSYCVAATNATGTFSTTCPVTLPAGRHVVRVNALGGPSTDSATATVTLVVTPGASHPATPSSAATTASVTAESGDPQPPSPTQALPTASTSPGPQHTSWRSALPSRRVLEVVGGIVGALVLLGLVGLLLRGHDTSEDTHFIDD